MNSAIRQTTIVHYMTNPDRQVAQANSDQCGTICDILASAFSGDPVMNWVNPHPEMFPLLFRAEIFPLYKPRGLLFINESNTGAAAWLPPGVAADAPFRWSTAVMIWNLYKSGGWNSLQRGLKVESLLKQHHIKEPHYYLFAIGASEGQQGRGIGSALLKAGLDVVDQNPHPVYLESSNVRNNVLYQRFGFEVLDEIQLPDNGPTMWPMLRPAK